MGKIGKIATLSVANMFRAGAVLLATILFFFQMEHSTEKKKYIHMAKVNASLTSGRYGESAKLISSLPDDIAQQWGYALLRGKIEAAAKNREKVFSNEELEVGYELIRLEKLDLATIFFEKLIKAKPQFLYDAERSLQLLYLLKTGHTPPRKSANMFSYSRKALLFHYQQILEGKQKPRIIGQSLRLVPKDHRLWLTVTISHMYSRDSLYFEWVRRKLMLKSEQFTSQRFQSPATYTSIFNYPPKQLKCRVYYNRTRLLEIPFTRANKAKHSIISAH